MEEVVQRVREIVEADPDLQAAWLFGSFARGEAHAGSDVDVAILTADGPPKTLDDLPVDLEDAIAEATGRPVQIVHMRGAPSDLVHRIMAEGILLLDRDRSARIRFEVDARNRYWDMLPIWNEYRKRR